VRMLNENCSGSSNTTSPGSTSPSVPNSPGNNR
jgi:hypothetical protein